MSETTDNLAVEAKTQNSTLAPDEIKVVPGVAKVPFNLQAAAKPIIRSSIVRPASVESFNTVALTPETNRFHFIIYSETNMRKTTIGASFGDPHETLIVLSRNKEQALPLRDAGYEVLLVKDSEGVTYGLTHYEYEFDLRKKQNADLGKLKFLFIDDVTDMVGMLVEDGGSADNRKNYGDAGKEMRNILKNMRSKDLDIGLVALAKFKENIITNTDRISPDLPPSMMGMIGAEFEYCFYVMPETYNLLTERDYKTFQEEVEGKNKAYRVEIFAKSKLPLSLAKVMPPILKKMEAPDLKGIWTRIQQASSVKSNMAPSAPVKTGVIGVGGIRK